MLERLRAIGPGALAAAAFIGPGTVTTATIAGAQYGFTLVWTLIFATFAAIALHEMAVRLGVVARLGLGEAIIAAVGANAFSRIVMIGLILSALFIGNAAYEGGNIAGAALGVGAAFPAIDKTISVAAIVLIAAALLFLGGYRVIEKALIAIVLIMSICFLAAFIVVRPDIMGLAVGAVPTIPEGSLLLVVGLIGTTIVPYNLFLHAAAAKQRWSETDAARALSNARFDAAASIGLGGLVSIMILSTAAASFFASGITVANGADMARQLEPAFGDAARYLIAIGLFAAGLSSAVTAPLATGYAMTELFNLEGARRVQAMRATMAAVLIAGAGAAFSGAAPISIIIFAQFANGLLLPIIGGFLLYAANKRSLLGDKVNGLAANIIGGVVLLVTAMIGFRALYIVANRFF